jgi:hypothetical protein
MNEWGPIITVAVVFCLGMWVGHTLPIRLCKAYHIGFSVGYRLRKNEDKSSC